MSIVLASVFSQFTANFKSRTKELSECDTGIQPVGIQPVGVAAVGSKPVGIQPVGVAAVGVAAVGLQPVDIQPVDIQPVDIQPVDIQPVETFDIDLSRKASHKCYLRSKLFNFLHISIVMSAGFLAIAASIIASIEDYRVGLAIAALSTLFNILDLCFKWGLLSETYAGLAYELGQISAEDENASVKYQKLIKRIEHGVLNKELIKFLRLKLLGGETLDEGCC
jgi:hypothetical protein